MSSNNINRRPSTARILCVLCLTLLISSCTQPKKIAIETQGKQIKTALTLSSTIESTNQMAGERTQQEPEKTILDPLLVGINPEDIVMAKAQAKRNFQRSWKTIGIRSRYVRSRLLATLEDLDAPTSLQVIPVVESTYDPYALSSAGALGLWQLMPRTAHVLGVRSEKEKNGRRNINDSTSAAARYLQSMYKQFDSWPLAIAAYNMGPYAVERRLRKQSWKNADGLENMPIPTGTRAYVQHVIGLTALLQDEELGFPEPIKTRVLSLQTPVDIELLAQISGLKKNDIFRFNPSLNQAQYLHKTIDIHIPVDLLETTHNNVALAGPTYVKQTIKSGDNLWDIARSHNTSVHNLKKLNKGMGKYLRIGQHLRVPANRLAQAVADHNPLLSSGQRIRYKVRSGDSLWRIATQFGTTPKAIARSNQISLNHILRTGDVLWVYAKVRPS